MLVHIDRPNLALLRGADYPGIVLMALFLGCLQYTLEEGPRWDRFGDDTIPTTAWISAIAGVRLCLAQPGLCSTHCRFACAQTPKFFARLLLLLRHRYRDLGPIHQTPLFLGRVRGFSAQEIGFAVFSTGFFQVLAIPV